MWRRKSIAGLIGVLMLAAAACSPPAESGGKTVTAALTSEPSHLNPLGPFLAADTTVLALIQDTLLVADQSGTYRPRLAESWTMSPDARSFTFKLRTGQTWSDGEPFTAADVVFTLKTFADPKVASPQSTRLSNVQGYADLQSGKAATLAGVTATGDDTVTIKLSTPDAAFLSLLAAGMYFFILPEHVLGKIDPAKLMSDGWWKKQNASMGPFTFGELQPDQRVIVNKNPKFREPVAFDRLILNILTAEVATGQLGTGEVDITPVGPLEAQSVRRYDGVHVEQLQSPGFNRIAVNMRRDYLKDKRIRQAILYAMDRPGMLKAALGGNGTIINSAFLTGWATPPSLQQYAHNPTKARQLLKDAGWNPNQVLLAPYDSKQADRAAVLNILVENFKQVGVKVKLETFDPSGTSPLKTGNWDLFIFGGGVYPIDPATLAPILICDQAFPKGGNISGYCNPALDQAMRDGIASADRGKRSVAYQRAALIENEDVPYLWTARPTGLVGLRDRVQGYVPWGDFSLGMVDVSKWRIN